MKNLIIKQEFTIKQSLKRLNQSGEKSLVVVDPNTNVLLGTISDGDLRRAILSGSIINDSISEIYEKNPTALIEGSFKNSDVKKIFINKKYDIIPVVNNKKELVNILTWDVVFKNDKKIINEKINIPVVIMAGGKGTRMEPFTKVLPKPLIPIHDRPIIEHIIDRFTNIGCTDFYLTLNYKGEILKAYFEELNPQYKISFVDEDEPLGTAGSLRFLEGQITTPFFVTNCDIIIKADHQKLYNFHLKNKFDITLVASAKEYIIPYGTCELTEDGHLSQINEKPEFNFLINTGLYVLNPDILSFIPQNKFYHITHLIATLNKNDKKIGVYPVDEDSWIDIGQWAEYKKAIGQL